MRVVNRTIGSSMTLTAAYPPASAPGSRPTLERFRALNEAGIPSTDPRRLAIALEAFPATRRDAPLDDGNAAIRLLTAVICTP